MLINFFLTLRKYKVPVSIRELMDLLAGLKHQLAYANVDDFYLLSRTAMVKDEKNYDKFDRAFSAYFKGLEDLHGLLESLIPDEWLRREFEKSLTPLGNTRTQLQNGFGVDIRQCLGISVGADKIHAFNVVFDHMPDGITTTATDTDHLYHRILWCVINQFKHRDSPLVLPTRFPPGTPLEKPSDCYQKCLPNQSLTLANRPLAAEPPRDVLSESSSRAP